MRKFLGEKYNKFSLRKLTVGVCSMTIGSFFLVSTVQPEENIVKAADNAIVHYKYVGEDNLTDKERELIKKEVPNVVSSTEETYYLVFKLTKTTQLSKLPNTGLNYGVGSMLLGGMLGLLVVVVVKGKNKSRKILSILLVTSMGATTLELPARAMEDLQLSVYNMDYNLRVGDKLPEISAIPGYSFVGFIKNETETKKENEEVKEKITSQQYNKKQPQLKEITDVNVTDKKQENKARLDNTDKKVLDNNKKEDKKVIENTNKKEDKKVLGVNTVNPQDEVLAGKLTKPELLYTDKTVETPIQYNQITVNNNQLPEGTTRIKQHGKLGKKIDVVRVFTVEGKEVSRELLSTKTEDPVSEIIEKGTKKVESTAIAKGEKLVKPAVEVKPEYTGIQAGAIVEPEKVEPKEYTGEQTGTIVESEKGKAESEDKKENIDASEKNDDKISLENKNNKENKVKGVNTVDFQDEVLSGKLTKPELLYSEKTIETPIQYNQIIENNNQLPEGTTRIKQHGKLGKKIDVVRVFTVEGKEVSRELLSTKTEDSVSEIIEKGTKKVESTGVDKEEKLEKPATPSLMSKKYQPTGKDQIVNNGEVPNPETSVNKEGLPGNVKVTWKRSPEVTRPGKTTGEAEVTYPDGSKEVVTVNITVRKISEEYIAKATGIEVKQNEAVTNEQLKAVVTASNKANAVDNAKILKVESKAPISTVAYGKQMVEATVTYTDGSEQDVTIPLSVKDETKPMIQRPEENINWEMTALDKNLPEMGVTAEDNENGSGIKIISVTGLPDYLEYDSATKAIKFKEGKQEVEKLPEEKESQEYNLTIRAEDNVGNASERTATITVSSMSKKHNPTGKDQTVNNGEVPNPETSVNKEGLPGNVTVTWKRLPEVTRPGKTTGEAEVTYPDSSKEIVTVNITVRKISEEYTAKATEIEVKQNETVTNEQLKAAVTASNKANAVDNAKISKVEPKAPISTVAYGKQTVEATVTYTDGSEQDVTIPLSVKDEKKDDAKEEKDDVKEEKEVIKKLELRNISSVELYSKEGDKYRHVPSLDSLPSNPETYFMKVKSENFKDVMLPVKNITNANKDNRDVYKIVASANNLIQHENSNVLENYTYYLPKTQQNETGVYTSFKNLVDAMNNNPNGTFRLGATMDAREVELPDGQESYIDKEFSGTLIGANNGKNYAIYNLKKPLFNALSHATIQDLSIKEANVSSKEDTATIAKEAKNGSKIINVHSSGVIAGERSIGGLISQVTNSEISNSSFTGRITNTYDTNTTYQIGGLVGKLSGASALIDRSISSIDMATNANTGDQVVGGIAGAVDKKATIKNSYVEGNLNNVKHFGYVGGVAGYLWDRESSDERNSGQLTNVLSDVNVTNGNAIAGYDFKGIIATNTYSNKNNKVVNVVQENDEVVSKDSYVQRGTLLESNQVTEKKDELVHKNNIKTEDFNFSSRYVTDYRNLENAVSSKEKVYKNIEKLLPFYNRETIVKYGNLVESNSNLYNKELLSVVPMKDKEVISDINKNKSSINKLLLYYADNTSETLNVNYQTDFSNVAEYRIGDTNLIYTPNTLLRNYNNILEKVLPALNSVEYKSEAIRKVLDVSNDVSLTELYLEEQFNTTKDNLRDSLTKLLTADAAIVENNNKVIDNYIIEKIKNNKEALLLGLTYLERWYNFKYGETKAKDLVMYHLDFFGKSNSSALDNVIELGKSGYNNLLAKNNVITYNVLLAKNYKTNNLFDALEKYRKVFVPDKTNNEWFKEQTKAYIVEEKSSIPEVSEKQSKAGTPQSIGVYDRLTSPSWKYQSMVLPLLTLPEEKTIFMIANISTIGFGAYDRYRSKEHPKGDKLNKFVEDNAQAAAKRFRDHYDYWYKILDDKNKEKLYRSVLVYDAFRFGNDEDNKTQEATFETDHPAIKHFFGPAGNNVVHNANGAYATGDAFYYMAYRMLDKDGAVTYTHEMTHNSDREIYLGGYGRRNGLGPEFYAKGLLQAPDHPYDPTITINSILKYEESENPTRLQVKDPTERFKNAEDLQKYMHNMFDVIYMLEYLEGNAVVNLDISKKNELLRKIENKFETDPDGSNTYATNVVRYLTGEELHKLNSFDSLIENDVITRRGYENGNDNTFKRNGYYTIKLFSPIYSALSNDKGTPGDLMGRRMAFELLAAKGFKDGMVPYISNQYAEEAKENGHVITSYGKVIGNVTDDLVLKKVFNNEYKSWVDFKKAMYEERKAKFNNLVSISFYNPNQKLSRDSKVTITNIDMLRKMITEAVKADAEDDLAKMYLEQSRVHKLKQAIFKAYLDQTNDFRTSIFGEQ